MLVYLLGYPLLTFVRVLRVLTVGYSEYSPWGTPSTHRGVLRVLTVYLLGYPLTAFVRVS